MSERWIRIDDARELVRRVGKNFVVVVPDHDGERVEVVPTRWLADEAIADCLGLQAGWLDARAKSLGDGAPAILASELRATAEIMLPQRPRRRWHFYLEWSTFTLLFETRVRPECQTSVDLGGRVWLQSRRPGNLWSRREIQAKTWSWYRPVVLSREVRRAMVVEFANGRREIMEAHEWLTPYLPFEFPQLMSEDGRLDWRYRDVSKHVEWRLSDVGLWRMHVWGEHKELIAPPGRVDDGTRIPHTHVTYGDVEVVEYLHEIEPEWRGVMVPSKKHGLKFHPGPLWPVFEAAEAKGGLWELLVAYQEWWARAQRWREQQISDALMDCAEFDATH